MEVRFYVPPNQSDERLDPVEVKKKELDDVGWICLLFHSGTEGLFVFRHLPRMFCLRRM